MIAQLAFVPALVYHGIMCYHHRDLVSSRGESTFALGRLKGSVAPGLYEHWKSKENNLKFYVVHGAGVEQDTHEPFVAYAALYKPHSGVLTFRHLLNSERGFLTPIDRAEYRGSRFNLVLKLDYAGVARILDCAEMLSNCTGREQFVELAKHMLKNQ